MNTRHRQELGRSHQNSEDKTRIVDFGKENGNVFDFLGFTFLWGRRRTGETLLKTKTAAGRLRKAILEFKLWIKAERNRYRLKVLWQKAREKLNGHYAYFGTTTNNKLGFYYFTCIKLLHKWLNRRSQKRSFSWKSFQERLSQFPLPKPWGHKRLDLAQLVFDFAI